MLPEAGELGPLLEEAGAEVVVRPLAVFRRGSRLPARPARPAPPAPATTGATWAGWPASATRPSCTPTPRSCSPAGSLGLPHLQHMREIYAGAAPAPLWPLWRRRLLRPTLWPASPQPWRSSSREARRRSSLHDGLPRIPGPRARATRRATRSACRPTGSWSRCSGGSATGRARTCSWTRPRRARGPRGDRRWSPATPGPARSTSSTSSRPGRPARTAGLRLLGFRDDVDTVLGAADAVAVPSQAPGPASQLGPRGRGRRAAARRGRPRRPDARSSATARPACSSPGRPAPRWRRPCAAWPTTRPARPARPGRRPRRARALRPRADARRARGRLRAAQPLADTAIDAHDARRCRAARPAAGHHLRQAGALG